MRARTQTFGWALLLLAAIFFAGCSSGEGPLPPRLAFGALPDAVYWPNCPAIDMQKPVWQGFEQHPVFSQLPRYYGNGQLREPMIEGSLYILTIDSVSRADFEAYVTRCSFMGSDAAASSFAAVGGYDAAYDCGALLIGLSYSEGMEQMRIAVETQARQDAEPQ